MDLTKGYGALAVIALVVAPAWFLTGNAFGGVLFLLLGLLAFVMAGQQARRRGQ